MSKDIQRIMDEEKQEITVNYLKDIMKKLKYIAEQAMDLLDVPTEDRFMYAGMVNAK